MWKCFLLVCRRGIAIRYLIPTAGDAVIQELHAAPFLIQFNLQRLNFILHT